MDAFMRRKTRSVRVRGVQIGGMAPVSIQSMCNTDTRDVEATCAQIAALAEAGCEIVRLAVPDEAAGLALKEIRRRTDTPLVADIHFDYRLALLALEAGVDKLRLNPGNIGGANRVRKVADRAKAAGVPIRIGVNSGSVERELLGKYGGPTPEAMVESALSHVAMLEDAHFEDIVISVKGSNPRSTVDACRIAAQRCDYPQHIGVTEAGSGEEARIKSAAAMGALLFEGIGDTIRVSITGDPVQEVHVAKQILAATGLRSAGIEVISCPTCGRTIGDIEMAVEQLKERLPETEVPLRVAVMGCAVNGPGEAREADFGAAFGRDNALLFARGKKLRSVPQDQVVEALLALVEERLAEEEAH